ncbi:hypothetical protein ONZ45_g6381 [Pleurotus djamor]|nr:hypothetical protein ONZ45_g6381 [Pleurotus djamor]
MMLTGCQDATRIATESGIDLKDISLDDARKIMSEEHKALGYRPPHGSLASAAQAAATKHSPSSHHIDEEILRKAAQEDAARIAAQRARQSSQADGGSSGNGDSSVGNGGAINLDAIGVDEARKLMSAEHKALGYRPPPGSLAADAQAAAAKHPKGVDGLPKPPKDVLTQEALKDAARIASERKSTSESSGSPSNSPKLSRRVFRRKSLNVEATSTEPTSTDAASTLVTGDHSEQPAQSTTANHVGEDGNRTFFTATETSPTMSAVAKAILKDHANEPMTKGTLTRSQPCEVSHN